MMKVFLIPRCVWVIYFLLIYLSISGCGDNVYNQRNYHLIKTDSFEGIKTVETYVYKYDTSRKMKINYHFNGTVLGRAFFHNKKLDGISETYNDNGELMFTDTFQDGGKKSTEKIK